MAFFGVSWKSFISISNDNRVCLFDAEAKTDSRNFVEKNHLAHTYTAFDWLGGKLGEKDLFAAGCSDGTVIIWDLTRGVVSKTLKIENKGVASAINFSLDRKSVFVSTTEFCVYQYCLTTGEQLDSIKCGKKAIMNIKCNPKANVMAIATSSSVRLMDLDDTEQKKKCAGSFSGGVRCLSFSQCGKYLVAASANSREVVVYNIQAGDGDNNEVSIMCTVSTTGIAQTTQVYHNKHSHQLYLGVILEDKNANIIRIDTKSLAVSTCTLNTQGKGGNNCSIFALTFDPNHHAVKDATAGTVVHVAVGKDKIKPQFQVITCEGSNGKMLDNVALVFSSKVAEAVASIADAVAPAPPTVMGPLDTITSVARPTEVAVSEKRKSVELEEEDGKKKKKSKKGKDDEVAVDNSVDGPKSVSFVLDSLLDGNTSSSDSMTLEQRLEALSSSIQRDDDDEEGYDSSSFAPNSSEASALMNAVPTSDSLVVLLEQSLQSGDDTLLEHCLACSDDDVIEETSKRLPISKVVLFLRKLVAKFEKRPSRGVLLTKWLTAILKFHLSYLITIPDLTLQLAGLTQMLENRLSSYSRLASLSGRLDLLVGLVQSKSSNESAAVKKTKTSKPVIVYDA